LISQYSSRMVCSASAISSVRRAISEKIGDETHRVGPI
jgi:hypothetical protein